MLAQCVYYLWAWLRLPENIRNEAEFAVPTGTMAQQLAEDLAAFIHPDEIAVFPGFFGYTKDGKVATFPRGGSDITGSILAAAVKADPRQTATALSGRAVALIFEKPSNRTRHSMEMAVVQLGGHPVYTRGEEVGIDVRESAEDVARIMAGYHAVLAARVFKHDVVQRMAAVSPVTVVNMLSDAAHRVEVDLAALAARGDVVEDDLVDLVLVERLREVLGRGDVDVVLEPDGLRDAAAEAGPAEGGDIDVVLLRDVADERRRTAAQPILRGRRRDGGRGAPRGGQRPGPRSGAVNLQLVLLAWRLLAVASSLSLARPPRYGRFDLVPVLLVLAFDGDEPVAGALNFIGRDALYGRYWGAVVEKPFLKLKDKPLLSVFSRKS